MAKRKKIRTKGKIPFSKYFQEFQKGDRASINYEESLQPKFPKRLQGRTGTIENRQGNAYTLKLKDQNKEKRILIAPIHLKKIK